MKSIITIAGILLCVNVFAQLKVTGKVINTKGEFVEMCSVALLHPADSTVAYFALSDKEGAIILKDVKAGGYLVNMSAFGYETIEFMVALSQENTTIGTRALKPTGTTLDAVDVVAERAPIVFKKDTIEYNAAAFKTKPDAVVEDLLKKLPGMEVDGAGNIKAQGSNIEKIMVDGKEFFSNDPKVVSKNLPADAVKKVQVFDEKTDEEQFSGVNDGDQNKTLNIVLKDDKKNLWFGTAQGGVGTANRFEGTLKAFNFTPNRQLAIMGMGNNVNQFGFSVQDYIDYNGGISKFMEDGGNIQLDGSKFPINFGQTIYGNYVSGVGALNYSTSKRKGVTKNVTYLGTGQEQRLESDSKSESYLNNATLRKTQEENSLTFNQNNRMNWSFKNKSDSLKLITVAGSLGYGHGRKRENSNSVDSLLFNPVNRFDQKLNNGYSETSGDLDLLYQRKHKRWLYDNWKIKTGGTFRVRESLNDWTNNTQFFSSNTFDNSTQRQGQTEDEMTATISLSSTKKLNKGWFFVPRVQLNSDNSQLAINQSLLAGNYQAIDSLTGKNRTQYNRIRPSLAFKRNFLKWNYELELEGEIGNFDVISPMSRASQSIAAFIPSMSVNYEFKQTNRLNFNASRSIKMPDVNQTNALISTINRLQYVQGNTTLTPETTDRLRLNWNLYDNFSFLAVFVDAQFAYTQNKINLSRTIRPDFSQSITYVNVPEDYAANGMIDFSAPIRKLKVNTHLRLNQGWNQGINVVNEQNNQTISNTQRAEFSIDNRKKTKWDGSLGIRYSRTNTSFSLQTDLNAVYENWGYFGTLDYTVKEKWNVNLSFDATTYLSSRVAKNTVVPLLSATVSRYIFKNNRGTLSMYVFDALNKNTGVQQDAALTYFRTTNSSILGRYVMLKLSYKLNKAGKGGGTSIKMK